MKPTVVVTQVIHDEVAHLLSEHTNVVRNKTLEPWPEEELLEHSRAAEALMVFMPDTIGDRFLASCPNLKIVAAALKGYDNFDVAACLRRKIWFTIVPDLLSQPTAELALALLLGLARNIAAGDELVRSSRFQGWRPILYGTGLAGSTVGLIGVGSVGAVLRRMLEPFGCDVLVSDPKYSDSVPLADLLHSSDFVVPLVPLTPETLLLINAQALQQMHRGAYLINVSRGSVVDEEAVADALESGHLAGYAADVFALEDWARADRPRQLSSRLLAMRDRTLFTPHLGSAVARVRKAIEFAAATSILQALSGKRPDGALNPD